MRKRDLKIAISGKSGCGNTTLSRLLAARLNLRFINFTFRNLGLEHGIELHEIMRLAEQDDYWDRAVDERQLALARSTNGCVLGSRLAIWMLTEADLKIYLKARPETRAIRIHRREGGDLAAIADFTRRRDQEDHTRYLRLYGIDNNNYDFADLIIDSDELNPQQIEELIIEELIARGLLNCGVPQRFDPCH